MMAKVFTTVGILVLLASSQASAFDGQRKGLVIGGGLGLAAFARTDGGIENSGPTATMLIGASIGNHLVIALLREGALTGEKDFRRVQGFTGITFHLYPGRAANTPYLSCGVGFQDYIALSEGLETHNIGVGGMVGAGFEISPHLLMSGSLSFGKTEQHSGRSSSHTQLMFFLTAIAY